MWPVLLHAANGGLPAESDFLFAQAETQVAAGRYLEAIGLYQTVADTTPDAGEKARALLLVGYAHAQYLDQHDKALLYFDYILTNWPGSAAAEEALYRKGMVLYETERYAKAYQAFTAYQERYPHTGRRYTAGVWAESAANLAATQALRMNRESLAAVRKDTTVRVLVAESADTVHLASGTRLTLTDTASGKTSMLRSQATTIGAKQGRLTINGKSTATTRCRITSPQPIAVNGTRYRGAVVVSADGGTVSAINHVDIEPYLYGVVPREMPASWPEQALMAQAVASRTYALYVKQKSADRSFDVRATTASQVYGGYDAEMPAANRAVDATQGQVLTYNGNLIVAYFHANSGGYTECPENVWGAALPYLADRPDRYSREVPGSQWEFFLPYDEAQAQLARYGVHVGGVRGFVFNGKSRSGRIQDVSVVSDAGVWHMPGNMFRLAIGSTRLKSMCFEAARSDQGVLFRGAGYGHGVGMSQWGARTMALEGHDYKTILKHYYRNITIASLDR
ncbi:SpoIID/LytB domain [Desulfosudis oleivorans Hxd3]|uniref:SpoIID/LytB domain n=2 Tax=Desulfosudis TaxID=2904716 RepID=A8ZRS8_DESOH|nr:SpoIID/LytB domain [Desulfosudis oleivorans Hxd3]